MPDVLFVTRKYPPSVGGMQRHAFELDRHTRELVDVTLVANRRDNAGLPAFLPRAAAVVVREARRHGVVHLGDALLAPLIPFARAAGARRVTCTVHGLDLTWSPRPYQAAIPRLLRGADGLACVSRATRDAAIARGLPPERCTVIPNGVDLGSLSPAAPLPAGLLPEGWSGRPLLLTVGRLVPRKGQAWFVRFVLPLLPDHRLAIAGTGPEQAAIERAAAEAGVADRVALLGRVSDEVRDALYEVASLFVMPNVPVAGDMEGFGITLIEASVRGLPAVSADLEGMRDAVLPGETGLLVPPGDPRAFCAAIECATFDRSRVASAARAAYSWTAIAARTVEFWFPERREALRSEPR